MNNQELLQLIRTNDRETFKKLYQQAYPSCQKLVLKNNGTMQDADDIFQEAILVLIRKARDKDFVLRINVNAFIYGVVRKLWLKKLQKEKKNKVDLVLDEDIGNNLKSKLSDISMVEIMEDRPQFRLDKQVQRAISALGIECRELLLDFYVLKLSLAELAQDLRLSPNYVKQKKHRCMQRLRKLYASQNPAL
ncbi:MAG: sigma-70 family RNA polymerase sigma factor [Saprospiraceae bacterium]|nr:sigma-70 family RNA polymerase sigma factor [Saprospiraceae bacterium]